MATVEAAESLRQLRENDATTFLAVSEVLLKYLNNIILFPSETKYRSVRLGNKVFQSKVLPVLGGIECLFAAGFQENDEYLSLPFDRSLVSLNYLQKELAGERLKLISRQVCMVTTAQTSELGFHQKLRSSADHVYHYEDPQLQQKARSVIPSEELKRKASQRLSSINQGNTDDHPLDVRDFLLLELLKWFKNRFFKWTDSPRCDMCGGGTRSIGMVEPTAEERRWEAGRVEGYTCTQCNRNVRFPRYNHPGKLLETRTGRCGEWANCFTLCCRAMGFEARHAVDWTDHVWTEVFSGSQQRWFHCDPCENVCDRPLLYEHGWGKKLSYVIAFSHEEVVDVTWRYTNHPQDVISRRTECREEWLMDVIAHLNKEKRQRLSAERVKVLEERLPKELAEFLTVKKVQEGEGQGRQSGSLAWRLNRGETTSGQAQAAETENYTFEPVQEEENTKLFHVRYCCASDTYIRVSNQNSSMEGWESCVFKQQNIFRKEEFDWNMVYLAREEGTPRSFISWKFDCSKTDLKINHVTVKACSTTFQSGNIVWSLSDGEKSVRLSDGTNFEDFTDFRGSTKLILEAKLTGGEGDVAWQHTQLFRMNSGEVDEFPFDWRISLI
ncbi:Peptide-N(4)-(N-acetyl-beta-glucosaminyl)asparagine amidase [Holothuria leucospilota]|uniref:Peptide-N(4)-(N-acetyl-beta-glucosaminyl)asparagine amidase n=1 Tax=Holothuria leucospilota TaxID=206669 RepID=A0A9Q1BCD0_HOLLE|nr:Peptide-N(4)-(N-acetyl-beta-glucosaminyl)asparagine amidase [Holothuria leucospilota]